MDHQHTLQPNIVESASYMCSGCKELGYGSSFHCENSNCNYILHPECVIAIAECDAHAVHPFFNKRFFKLREKAGPGGFCDACGKDLLGFFYHCSQTDYALHPCCLKLQDKFCDKDGKVLMTLCDKVPSKCVHCKDIHVARNQFEGWSYVVNSDGRICVHVKCFKDMVLQSLNNNKRSKGRKRAIMKFTGKLVVKLLIDVVLMDPTSFMATIVEVAASGFFE